jgi:hypothetical protein
MRLTKEEVLKYITRDELKWLKESYDFLSKSPTSCNECGSSDIEIGDAEIESDGDAYFYPVHCNACGASYEQRYNMTGRENLLKYLDDEKKHEAYKDKLYKQRMGESFTGSGAGYPTATDAGGGQAIDKAPMGAKKKKIAKRVRPKLAGNPLDYLTVKNPKKAK